MAFAIVIISGCTLYLFAPNASPVLPNPVITSSNTNTIPCLSHVALSFSKYPFGGTRVPVDPAIGSTKQPAIDSGPYMSTNLCKSSAK